MTIRKIAAWVIALSMVLSLSSFACAEESEPAWGTSQSSTVEKMGEPDETDELRDCAVLRYHDKSFGKYTSLAVYVFRNDGLICRGYLFREDTQLSIYQDIGNELETEYGESAHSLKTLYDYLIVTGTFSRDDMSYDTFVKEADAVQDKLQFMTWETDSRTCICLYTALEGDQQSTYLVYYQPDDTVSE